jgi:hypothetical protein
VAFKLEELRVDNALKHALIGLAVCTFKAAQKHDDAATIPFQMLLGTRRALGGLIHRHGSAKTVKLAWHDRQQYTGSKQRLAPIRLQDFLVKDHEHSSTV